MSGTQAVVVPSRLLPGDILRVGAIGLMGRRLRAALSVLGIAIGIAALVSVLGISNSSRADLLAQLDSLGTNLLTAQASTALGSDVETLPSTASSMASRIGPVQEVSSIATVSTTVRRSPAIPSTDTGGISVVAVEPNLLTTLNGTMTTGRFLDAATDKYPTVVLGSKAAERLGIDRVGRQVWLGGRTFTVIGIMDALPLSPDLDRAALIGAAVAGERFNAGENLDPSKLYIRTDPKNVTAVRDVVAETVNPETPSDVEVSRPSDALEARAAADKALTALFLGLGLVALLVGGIGIANVMVISVLERRSEIGLRRALGATKRHIKAQFLTESLLLSAGGGLVGVVLGCLVTAGYAISQGWSIAVPTIALVGGMVAALVIGAVAGLYPAMRAARLAPTDALRSA
jgi:putative ABC transport system permease protein